MERITAQEIMDLWRKNETDKAKAERREVEALRRDLNQAQAAISDAIARYRKQKLRARSKAKANAQDPFQDLAEYASVDEIRDAYGYEIISESEMSRLVNLWELREESRHASVPYSDRVIEMLELASRAMWNAYGETISEYDAKIAAMQKEARRIAEENFRRAANRETT